MVNTKFLNALFLTILFLPLSGRGKDEILLLFQQIQNHSKAQQPDVQPRPTNETAIIGIQLIRFYQKHISSQDRLGVCIYSTSCSHFALLAVKRKGFVLGTLLTADRLQRCNSAASQYYFLDPSTGKCVDPIIRLWLEK